MNKIDKIKNKAMDKIELLKVENNVLEAENETLEIRHNNIILENKVGLFDRLKHSGFILSMLGLFSFLVSTILSLISGYTLIRDPLLFIGFALIMIVCQIIIFISSKYSTLTKDKFIHRYSGLKLMQIAMVLVSLTLNVMFIHACFNSLLLDVIIFPLCFILDYSTIFFAGMSYDFKTLTFNVDNSKITLLDMLVDNIINKTKTKIIETYNKNNNILENKDIVLEIEPVLPSVLDDVLENVPENILENKENILENILEYLRENYILGEVIDKFQEKFKLSEYEYKKIRDELVKKNVIECKNRRMYYIGNIHAISNIK